MAVVWSLGLDDCLYDFGRRGVKLPIAVAKAFWKSREPTDGSRACLFDLAKTGERTSCNAEWRVALHCQLHGKRSDTEGRR